MHRGIPNKCRAAGHRNYDGNVSGDYPEIFDVDIAGRGIRINRGGRGDRGVDYAVINDGNVAAVVGVGGQSVSIGFNVRARLCDGVRREVRGR